MTKLVDPFGPMEAEQRDELAAFEIRRDATEARAKIALDAGSFTVTVVDWRRQNLPVEGWISNEYRRQFKTRSAAELFIRAMKAGDEDLAARKGIRNRAEYELTEDAST